MSCVGVLGRRMDEGLLKKGKNYSQTVALPEACINMDDSS